MGKTTLLELIAFAILMLSVPCIFIIIYYLLGISFIWKPFLLGALGWYIALMLRLPFIFIIRKLNISETRKTTFTIMLSGPTEEITRLAFIILISFNLHSALFLGLGWATIEVIYAIIQAVGSVNLRSRIDEKAMKAKKLLDEQGMGTLIQEHSPVWGVLERLSATFIHLGFTILLLVNPFIVLVDMLIHSSINLLSIRIVKKSVALMEMYLLIISSLLLTAALLLYYR